MKGRTKGTQYSRGARKEYAAMKALRALGYECTRSAGSHGLWDITAVFYEGAFLIQVWYTKQKTGTVKDTNLTAFRKLKVPENIRKRLWIYRYGKAIPEVHEC